MPPLQQTAPTVQPAPGQPVTFQAADVQIVVGPPRTREELAALRGRQRELGNQLTSTESRRSRTLRELREADGDARPALVQRLEFLDQRILQLERDINVVGQQISAASPALAAVALEPPREPQTIREFLGFNPLPVLVLLVIFVLGPMSGAFARAVWKRPGAAALPPGLSELPRRMERLEQAVDAVAIEVERISEGQRFVTKILADQPRPSSLAPAEAARPRT
jgi:hypothetical protein